MSERSERISQLGAIESRVGSGGPAEARWLGAVVRAVSVVGDVGASAGPERSEEPT